MSHWHFYAERMADFVSEPEAMVMETIRLHVPMLRDDFAAWTLREFGHLELPYSKAEVDDAIASLIAKRLIRVLSAKDVCRPPPKYSTCEKYFSSSAGLLDWTRAGNALAKQIYPSGEVRQGT